MISEEATETLEAVESAGDACRPVSLETTSVEPYRPRPSTSPIAASELKVRRMAYVGRATIASPRELRRPIEAPRSAWRALRDRQARPQSRSVMAELR